MEYASSVWDPHQIGYVNAIEQVQRKAARFVTNCKSQEPGCVRAALKQLNWPPLQKRQKQSRLELFHRTTHGPTSAIKIPDYVHRPLQVHNTRHSHPFMFHQPP